MFDLDLQDGYVVITEFSLGGMRWIKYPQRVLVWVVECLRMRSTLEAFEYQKMFGALVWLIKSGKIGGVGFGVCSFN